MAVVGGSPGQTYNSFQVLRWGRGGMGRMIVPVAGPSQPSKSDSPVAELERRKRRRAAIVRRGGGSTLSLLSGSELGVSTLG